MRCSGAGRRRIGAERRERQFRDDRGILLEISDVESVEAGRAAEHARVRAETPRSRVGETRLERLQDSIVKEELRALFELRRDELTEPEMPTAGKRSQSGEFTE